MFLKLQSKHAVAQWLLPHTYDIKISREAPTIPAEGDRVRARAIGDDLSQGLRNLACAVCLEDEVQQAGEQQCGGVEVALL